MKNTTLYRQFVTINILVFERQYLEDLFKEDMVDYEIQHTIGVQSIYDFEQSIGEWNIFNIKIHFETNSTKFIKVFRN